MSGQRRVGSSVGSGFEDDLRRRARDLQDEAGQFEHGALVGVPDVDGADERRVEERHEAADLVLDETQAPGLAAVSVHGQRITPQCLHDEVGHDAAVAGGEPRAVGVEDAHDAHVDAVRPVHGHGQALGEPLGLVVDAARPRRIDVAPVALHLRVHLGVAVDLAGARHQEPRLVRPGQLEQPPGALAAHGQRVERPGEVRRRRRRGGQVAHGVDLAPRRAARPSR